MDATPGGDGFGDHRVLVSRNAGTAGCAEIENGRRVDNLVRGAEIAAHEAADVFSQGYAKIVDPLAPWPDSRVTLVSQLPSGNPPRWSTMG
jgi:hypothetical protein